MLALTAIISILFWYATYSTKSGFAIDQNNNQIPDKWEKIKIIYIPNTWIFIGLFVSLFSILINE